MGSITEWMSSPRPTIIYGAGTQASYVYRYCARAKKKCVAIMTTSDTKRLALPDETVLPHTFPNTYEGDKSTVDVIIALGGGTDEVRKVLETNGYLNVYWSENWKEGNKFLYEGNIASYRFCEEMAQFQIVFDGNLLDETIHLCCNHQGRPAIKFGKTPEETFNRLFATRARCIAEYVTHESDGSISSKFCCAACENLERRDSLWHYAPSVTWVNINMKPAPCQCKCIYCGDWRYTDTPENKAAYQRMLDILQYGKATGLIAKHAIWMLASGEITIHPFREELLNLVRDTNARFVSNCFLFDKEIGQILHNNPGAFYNTSIDCGTAETWKKIKQVDNFEKVVSNLYQYAACCHDAATQLTLKYIVLPGINDNENDYLGVFHLIRQLGTKNFVISRDVGHLYKFTEYREAMVDGAAELLSYCVANKMIVEYDIWSPSDIQEIQKRSGQKLQKEYEKYIIS